MKTTLLIPALFLFLARCSNNPPAGSQDTSGLRPDSAHAGSSPHTGKTILNNIVVKEKGGLEITSAYLTGASGHLINPKNTVSPGSAVYLTLQINKGWTVENGFVSPGATQTISTSKGEPVLQSTDLFAGVQKIKARDAATLQLKTRITVTRADIPYYVVRFRIWDKRGPGAAEGHYLLRINRQR